MGNVLRGTAADSESVNLKMACKLLWHGRIKNQSELTVASISYSR